MGFTREIVDRRVLPVVGVYIGACWVVVEILDRMVERYFLSPYITDVVFWGLFSLVPAVILLAWTHGRPGRDEVTRAERIGIPANLILTAGLLITVFGDRDMSATADLVTMANELGQEEVHYVPRESYRRRIAVFFWDSEDPDLEWLRYGVTELLTQDLQQNPFIYASSPWERPEGGLYAEMKEAGFDDGLDVPLTLKREIADQANRDYFVDGTIERSEQQYLVTARVWETDSFEQLQEISAQGWDLMRVVDDLSTEIRELLDTPPGMGDLPLVETYGESEEALRFYLDGRNAVVFENDREKANLHYDQAIQADSGFVLAWFMKSLSLWQQGNVAGAQQALEETRKLSYRLPERDQVSVKLMAYRISGEQDKVEALLRMQTQIVGDALSHQRLAEFLELAGELEEAKEHFRRQMEVDSTATGVLLRLARLERSTGDVEAAIAHAQRYVEQEPEGLAPLILLGELFVEAGDMDQARSYLERAQIIEEPPMMSTLSLAMLSIRQGEWMKARELIAESRDMAASARHAIMALQVESYLEFRLGRIGRSLELTQEQLPFIQEALTPVEQVFTYNSPVIKLYTELNRLDEAESALLTAKQALQPPMDQFFAFSEVTLAARRGDLDDATAALEAGMRIIEHFKADFMSFMVPRSEAEIAEARGDYSAAGRFYRETIEQMRRSVIASGSLGGQSELYGACARAHVRARELDVAQSVLDHAFKRDGAEPRLWAARAMLQEANGSTQMALASINYALAIWADADPDYVDYQEALDLRQRLEAAHE